MILSVSRRTDIPNFYSDWFYERIKAGFVYVSNPRNPSQVSRVELSPEIVDCIVFWTKNPEPMMRRINELAAYRYYFQFTLTGYGKDMEPGIPDKWSYMIPVFQKLAGHLGEKGIVWRYDPVIFSKWHTPEWHLETFRCIAEKLCGYTERVVISFVDDYAGIRKNMARLEVMDLAGERLLAWAARMSAIAQENGMAIYTCAEHADLSAAGIRHGCCIDAAMVEQVAGCKMELLKDKHQRSDCGCMESIDIGVYHTCPNGCVYCYANRGTGTGGAAALYDVRSPALCRELKEDRNIPVKKVKSQKREQMHMKDYLEYFHW